MSNTAFRKSLREELMGFDISEYSDEDFYETTEEPVRTGNNLSSYAVNAIQTPSPKAEGTPVVGKRVWKQEESVNESSRAVTHARQEHKSEPISSKVKGKVIL
jgi:hypothetical protein